MNQLEEKLSIVETTSSNLDELKNIKNKLFNKNLISCAKILDLLMFHTSGMEK